MQEYATDKSLEHAQALIVEWGFKMSHSSSDRPLWE